jgi:hypothetical protein
VWGLTHVIAHRLTLEGVALAALGYLLPGLLLYTAARIAGSLAPGGKGVPGMATSIILILLYVVSGTLLEARPPRSVRRAFLALSALPLGLAAYTAWAVMP